MAGVIGIPLAGSSRVLLEHALHTRAFAIINIDAIIKSSMFFERVCNAPLEILWSAVNPLLLDFY